MGPFALTTAYHERVWGGRRLKRCSPPVGEAWVVEEGNFVADGPRAGETLAAVCDRAPLGLLGTDGAAARGGRFPMIIKLLDTADWISVQVHPDDETAALLEGPRQIGKTEAWHVVEAERGAEIVTGLKAGTPIEAIGRADDPAAILAGLSRHCVEPGETAFVSAGTIHSLGPGLLIYEVQQASHITYRATDWGRGPGRGRAIDIDRFSRAADPARRASILPPSCEEGVRLLADCEHFRLEQVIATAGVHLEPGGRTFHAVTAVAGMARIENDDWRRDVGALETVIVPGDSGAYRLSTSAGGRALIASIPPVE